MLDLLAAISSVDPPALLAWLVFLFAASGYPLGIMLGSSCSACCAPPPPCTQCTEGELPETLTVTFSGLADKAPGPDLIALSFSACYGGGAAAQVTAPGGDPATDKGPIGAVTLTNGGSGYAKLGRVAPTLTVSGGSGTGATFTPSLSTSQDGCKLDLWSLASVSASGGTDYADGDTLTITVAEGDTEVAAASATLYLDKSEPTLTLDGAATATVSMAALGDGNFGIASVAVTGGGSGYTEGESLTFSVGANDETVAAATATARVVHGSPANELLYEEGTGSGAVLTPVWTLLPTNQWPAPHRKTYSVSSVTITNGGSGYSSGDYFEFYFASDDDGQIVQYGYGLVDAVNGSGAITAVSIEIAGRYVGSRTDQLESVAIASGGSYYNDDPGARSVIVNAGGTYYREDASVAPYVATVTVGVSQTLPSAGTGATLTATVESSTSSANFGKITGVTITSGGTNYLAWQWRNTKCCGDYYNGLSVVVKRLNYGDSNPCRYEHRMCGVGNIRNNVGRVEVFYNGPTTPPYVALQSEIPPDDGNSSSICNTTFTASGNVTNCSDWSGVSFSASGGATASVSAGGEYDATFKNPGGASCHICCKGDEVPPQEITVSVSGASGSGYFVSNATNAELNYSWDTLDGDWVLSRGVGLSWYLDPPLVVQDGVAANPPPLSVSIEPCSSQNSAGFGEDGFGCDFCHKKCRVVFSFTGFEQRFCLGSDPNHCGGCSDTPRCSPAGASFTMCTTRYLEAIGEFLWVRNKLGFPHQTNPNPPPVAGTIIADNDCTDYGEPPEWTKYPFRLEVDPVTGIGTGNYVYDYAWPRPGNRCPMNVTIS